MTHRAARTSLACAGLSCAGLMLTPGLALAHASDRAVILTLPTKGFIWGAGAAVAATALVAGLGARLPGMTGRALFSRPALLPDGLTSWLSAGLLLALIFIGFAGSRDPAENLLPLTVWTLIWVGLTVAQAVFGNLWRDLNPWRGPVRSLRGLLGRSGGIGLSRLGQWPAVAGYLGFVWLEIIAVAPADPARLALIAGVYVLLIFGLAVLEGEDWLDQGEFLTAFFTYVARIAPLWADYDKRSVIIHAGLPGTQVLALPPLRPSAIAFVTLALASVSFDGLHDTFRWVAAIGLNPLDYPGRSAVTWVNTAGLLATWAIMAALILTAAALLRRGVAVPPPALTGALCLSLLPIAAGYHVAHYLTALLTQGQYVIAALSDPLANGSDLLGLGPYWVGFGFLANPDAVWRIWIAQFACILMAHLVAVLLAERIVRQSDALVALWAKIPMALLMVLYTCFGLWLLATPAMG